MLVCFPEMSKDANNHNDILPFMEFVFGKVEATRYL